MKKLATSIVLLAGLVPAGAGAAHCHFHCTPPGPSYELVVQLKGPNVGFRAVEATERLSEVGTSALTGREGKAVFHVGGHVIVYAAGCETKATTRTHVVLRCR